MLRAKMASDPLSACFASSFLRPRHEFLQAVAIGWDEAAIAARRHHDLGDVDAAAGINVYVVRGEEIAGRRGVISAAPAGNQSALRVEDAYATARGVGSR